MGTPQGTYFFSGAPWKNAKIYSFWARTIVFTSKWTIFSPGIQWEGSFHWVLGSQFCTKKLKNISEFQKSWNFWIFGSWTQSGAWHMIVPFWSWNLSDTTRVRSHTKFQLVWAINTVFTRGGHNVPPPSLKCVAGTPSLLGLMSHRFLSR